MEYDKKSNLRNWFLKFNANTDFAVAVSGGVDSLTLGTYVNRLFFGKIKIFHSVTPSVPPQATDRVTKIAREEKWDLQIINPNEFEDDNYLKNPLNRCFYCKTNLYETIARCTTKQIISGTNLDDLSEFRPGLSAAEKLKVKHPFVEVSYKKIDVRELARDLGLGEISELPASPCLSSRIETGIGIDARILKLVNETEILVDKLIKPKTVRCRVRGDGIHIELDQDSFIGLTEKRRIDLKLKIKLLFGATGLKFDIKFDPYRVGSAFVS